MREDKIVSQLFLWRKCLLDSREELMVKSATAFHLLYIRLLVFELMTNMRISKQKHEKLACRII